MAKVASTSELAPRRRAGTFMRPFYRPLFPRPNACATLALVGGGLTASAICNALESFSTRTRLDFACVFADDLSRKAASRLMDHGFAGWTTPNGVLLLTHGQYTTWNPDTPMLRKTAVAQAAARATAAKGPLWDLAEHDTYVLIVGTHGNLTHNGAWSVFVLQRTRDALWRYLTPTEHAQYDQWLTAAMLPLTWPPNDMGPP